MDFVVYLSKVIIVARVEAEKRRKRRGMDLPDHAQTAYTRQD